MQGSCPAEVLFCTMHMQDTRAVRSTTSPEETAAAAALAGMAIVTPRPARASSRSTAGNKLKHVLQAASSPLAAGGQQGQLSVACLCACMHAMHTWPPEQLPTCCPHLPLQLLPLLRLTTLTCTSV